MASCAMWFRIPPAESCAATPPAVCVRLRAGPFDADSHGTTRPHPVNQHPKTFVIRR